MIIPIILYIAILVLSVIVFKSYGMFILLITTPLLILYHKVGIINKRSNDKDNLSEGKEVEFVSTKNRKENIKPKKDIIKKLPKINLDKGKKNKKRKEKDNAKKRSIGRKLLTALLCFFILCVFGAMAFIIYIVVSTGSFDPEALKNQDQTVIYDKDGEIITTLGAQKRESVTYDQLPEVLVDAIVATEDSRYYQHNGVDTARFLKASIFQVLGQSDAGGASTLTMQVVKNNLTSTESSGISGIIRKFKDVYISVFFMEKKYSKEEILELYVNDSCLGGTIYGVQEASKYYFGKDVSELTLPEAALLAGMYQAPNRYNPYKDPEAAEKRRNTVLSLMVRHGYITKEEMNMANAVSIESMLAGDSREVSYQGYIDTVLEEVERKTGNSPVSVSMKIYTALDRDIQDGINKVLSGEAHDWEDDEVQAGIAVIDVNNGTIVAIGAGRNRTAGDWNYATQAYRQPGSTAKPLFDYGPGFEYNHFSTYTLFVDEPWSYTSGPEIGNWDGGYEGLITLRRALSVSRNIPALKAFQQVNKKNIAEFVNGLGLDVAYSTKDDNYKTYDNGADNLLNEAYAIGGVGYGFTPLDMAEAYACFANGGYHIESHAVTKIEYRSTGEVVEFEEKKEKVMSDSTAYLINNVLKYAVDYAFNGGAKVAGSTVAAKTGTSNLPSAIIQKYGLPDGAVNDLWTVAYTPEYSVSLWYGYKEVDSSHYLGGASAPKDAVMRSVMQYIPKTTKEWTMPSSVVQATVEKDSWPAQLPSEYTPEDLRVTEYFIKGYQPTEVSERFAKLPAVTNLKSTPTTKGYKLTWNWKTPDVLSNSYLTNYFSNYVFGNSSSTYLSARINYNETTLGGIGFGIYEKSKSGVLTRVGFTKDQEYTYVPKTLGDVNLVVKAEYGEFKANASDPVDIKVSVTDLFKPDSEKLEVTLNEGLTPDDEIVQGHYTDPGVTVKFDGKEVNTAVITYIYDGLSYHNKNLLENEINKLASGSEVTIKYKVNYTEKNVEKTVERNIKIK